MSPKKKQLIFTPTRTLVIAFALLILMGTMLLSLPIASVDGESAGFITPLFTSTSAVCVTGLVVRDTATEWTLYGQIVILALIQLGGLGFMTYAYLIYIILGRRMSLRNKLVLQESINEYHLGGLSGLIRRIMIATFTVESMGVLFFSTRFIPMYGPKQGLYMSIFHSISAFCNAGFDVVGRVEGPYVSFIPYAGDIVINLTTMLLIVCGGLGFSVLLDMFRNRRFNRLTLHSKIVLITTAALILGGAVFFFSVEYFNPQTLGAPGQPLYQKVLESFFQSVTTRTAGYNTISQSEMTTSSRLMSVVLMFIGASPAGTGGGIKTSTFALLLLMILTVVRGKQEITVFHRSINPTAGYKALAITAISFALVIGTTMVLSMAEPDISFDALLFEATSAFGTVGLSTGITPTLAPLSKIMLILSMYAGRVGPLTLAMSLTHQIKGLQPAIHYPEGRIIVG